MTNLEVYSLLLGAGGGALLYWRQRRTFLRSNLSGTETFPTYGRKVITEVADSALLVMGLGAIMASVVMLLFVYAGETLLLAIILYAVYRLDRAWHDMRK